MSTTGSSGIARRRNTLRRGVIAALVIVCLALFTGYFRESTTGPLHGVQNAAASVVSPVQEVATRAVKPVRDAWGWMTSLRDARDRAAALEAENEQLRGQVVFDDVREQRLIELEALAGVEPFIDTELGRGGYRVEVALMTTRSITDWYRSARIAKGSSSGIVRNSPVVAGTGRGAALVGVVTSVSSDSADVAFITDGRTEVGATVPEAGAYPGLLRSTSPGQLSLTQIPRAAALKELQAVVTRGFAGGGLPSIYPPGLPVGQITSVGRQEVDVAYTVQVTPYVDPRQLSYLAVLVPESPQAKRRASGR